MNRIPTIGRVSLGEANPMQLCVALRKVGVPVAAPLAQVLQHKWLELNAVADAARVVLGQVGITGIQLHDGSPIIPKAGNDGDEP